MTKPTLAFPAFDSFEWIQLRGAVTDKLKYLTVSTPAGAERDKLLARWQSLEDKVDEAANVTHASEN